MKGIGTGYLRDCSCPVDTALVELFTIKSTAGVEGVFVPDDETKRDFFFNPVNLTLVRAVIAQTSGLDTRSMFMHEPDRLSLTAIWALERLQMGYIKSETVKNRISQIMAELTDLLTEGEDD
jgi:hypothetical protein